MALIKCPECGMDISEKAASCIHCGYPLEKVPSISQTDEETTSVKNEKMQKKSRLLPILLLLLFVVIVCIEVSNRQEEQRRIAFYRADFSSEADMYETLMSGKWVLTSFGGGYTLGDYLIFNETQYEYIVTDKKYAYDFDPTDYTIDWKNSTILVSGDFQYDVIDYRNDLYIRQNPKVEADDWILMRLYPY